MRPSPLSATAGTGDGAAAGTAAADEHAGVEDVVLEHGAVGPPAPEAAPPTPA